MTSLLEFSSQSPPVDRWPVVIIYPAHPWLAVPAGWERRPDGRIKAVYHNESELRWSVLASLEARAVHQERQQASGNLDQAEMFPQKNHNYS